VTSKSVGETNVLPRAPPPRTAPPLASPHLRTLDLLFPPISQRLRVWELFLELFNGRINSEAFDPTQK